MIVRGGFFRTRRVDVEGEEELESGAMDVECENFLVHALLIPLFLQPE